MVVNFKTKKMRDRVGKAVSKVMFDYQVLIPEALFDTANDPHKDFVDTVTNAILDTIENSYLESLMDGGDDNDDEKEGSSSDAVSDTP